MASDLERRRRRHNAGSCQPSVLLVIPSEVEESLISNREIAGDVSTFARHDKTGTDALQMKIDLHTNILPPGVVIGTRASGLCAQRACCPSISRDSYNCA